MVQQRRCDENLNSAKLCTEGDTSTAATRPLSKGIGVMKSATAITVLLAASISSTDAFSPSPNLHSNRLHARGLVELKSLRYSNRREDGDYSVLNKSYSHTALSVKKERKESRLGVRRRVRSVLERARSRTGIENSSEYLDRKEKDSSRDIPSSSFNLADIEFEASDLDFSSKDGASEAPGIAKANGTSETKISDSSSKRSEPISIKKANSINVIAQAAAIGGIGSDELDYTPKSSSTEKKKTKPASTYSEPIVKPSPTPGADFMPAESKDLSVVDALKGDVSAAFSAPPPPLPFTLPKLTKEQRGMLRNGERIQYQSDMGREGSGYVVLDVKAPAAVVWECLLDFYSYPQTIPTVRDVQMFTNTHLQQNLYSETAVEREKYEDGTLATLKHGVPSVTRASFSLSKFRLKIAAIHKYRPHPLGDYMVFTLDPACTNMVLQNAKGVWYTESNPDGRGDEYTRVWLLCELSVSSLLPQWITDYAAKRAMPRATTWIKPHVEAAAQLWYKELKD